MSKLANFIAQAKSSNKRAVKLADSSANRRDFLKISGLGTFAAFVGAKLFSQTAGAQAPAAGQAAPALTMVKPTDPMAQSLGYYEDAAKVDTKKWPKKAGKDGAKQYCYNCQFYQSKEKDRKETKAAPCTIFQGKGVAAKGWCNSWTQDPTVKG